MAGFLAASALYVFFMAPFWTARDWQIPLWLKVSATLAGPAAFAVATWLG